MLDLDDFRWNNLKDAYGKASRIPDLLHAVLSDKAPKSDRQSGPWFELWARLCHQGSIYTGPYAAVPSLVEGIKNADGPIAMDFFLLPVSIEVARQEGNAPALPHEIEHEYHAAIRELGPLAKKYTSNAKAIDQTMRKVTRAAELVSDGFHDEAAALIDS
jgi:hypothetical protein